MIVPDQKGPIPVKLTQRLADTIALPAGRTEAVHYDDALPGFGLRIREGGSRVFVVQYKLGQRHRRMTLGSIAQLRLDDARSKARDILAAVRLGRDPAGEKIEAVAALADHCEPHMRRYLTSQRSRLRPSSMNRAEHHLLDHWKPLHAMPLIRIDRRAVAARLSELAADRGPAAADRARAALSAFFVWAMKEGLIEANPVLATNRPYDRKGRERVLSEAEIVKVWRAAGDDSYGTIVKLLLLTGQRREEIGGLRWSEVDFAAELIRLPPPRVKNGRAHEVPLSDPAIALLHAMPQFDGRDLVFGSGANGLGAYSIPKRALDQRIATANGKPLPPWVLHDLRRTCATHMAEFGVQPHIIEAVINHASGHKAGVAGTYNRATYDKDKRAALAMWADHVMAAVERHERGPAAGLVRYWLEESARPAPSPARASCEEETT
jgi:integrase